MRDEKCTDVDVAWRVDHEDGRVVRCRRVPRLDRPVLVPGVAFEKGARHGGGARVGDVGDDRWDGAEVVVRSRDDIAEVVEGVVVEVLGRRTRGQETAACFAVVFLGVCRRESREDEDGEEKMDIENEGKDGCHFWCSMWLSVERGDGLDRI